MHWNFAWVYAILLIQKRLKSVSAVWLFEMRALDCAMPCKLAVQKLLSLAVAHFLNQLHFRSRLWVSVDTNNSNRIDINAHNILALSHSNNRRFKTDTTENRKCARFVIRFIVFRSLSDSIATEYTRALILWRQFNHSNQKISPWPVFSAQTT